MKTMVIIFFKVDQFDPQKTKLLGFISKIFEELYRPFSCSVNFVYNVFRQIFQLKLQYVSTIYFLKWHIIQGEILSRIEEKNIFSIWVMLLLK